MAHQIENNISWPPNQTKNMDFAKSEFFIAAENISRSKYAKQEKKLQHFLPSARLRVESKQKTVY